MKRNYRLMNLLLAPALLLLAATLNPVRAETLTTLVGAFPGNEVPPVTNLNATGGFQLTIEVTRDAGGNITNGRINFLGVVQFPGAVTITGLRLHEGELTGTGQIRFDSGLSAASPLVLPGGAGIIDRDVTNVDRAVLARLLANPASFYLNLHTTIHPGGALRGQLGRLLETLSDTLAMTTAQEVPPPTGLTARADAALSFSPTRDAQGRVNGGNVLFTLIYDFPGAVTFTGLHIHEAAFGANGPVRLNTGLGANNTIVSATGKGTLNLTAPVTTADEIAALSRLFANPAGFYVNLHTTAFPDGAVRGQLSALGTPPVLVLADKYFLPVRAGGTTLSVLTTGVDQFSTVLLNGQQVPALPDPNTGNVNISVPTALTASPGTLMLQIRSANGFTSRPLFFPVAAQASVNTQAVAVIESAGFSRGPVAPEAIVAAFGTRLASQTVGNSPGQMLPTTLDGTTLYVNGVPAQLFFVSPNQINFLLPEGTNNTFTGPANLVVVARDGSVSQGLLPIVTVAPGLFTRTANGLGAPAAVASTDGGATFPIQMANADGTPVEIQAGNVVVLFGTGLRFKSGAVTATAGGVTSTPLFVGAQGGFAGLDQINWVVPQSLAGKGEMDLTFTLDGKTTNAVKIKVR